MSVLDEVKSLVSIAHKLKDGELIAHVMNLQTKVLEYQDQIHRLEKENEKIKQEISTRQSLTFRKSAYFQETENGEDGPFCQRCYDVDKNLVRLQDYGHVFYCQQCRNTADKPDAV